MNTNESVTNKTATATSSEKNVRYTNPKYANKNGKPNGNKRNYNGKRNYNNGNKVPRKNNKNFQDNKNMRPRKKKKVRQQTDIRRVLFSGIDTNGKAFVISNPIMHSNRIAHYYESYANCPMMIVNKADILKLIDFINKSPNTIDPDLVDIIVNMLNLCNPKLEDYVRIFNSLPPEMRRKPVDPENPPKNQDDAVFIGDLDELKKAEEDTDD